MRLFEAIVDANHRALAGDSRAGINPARFVDSLPAVALTCFDPRMHPLMPEVLGVAEPDFIWVTNAGNVITSSLGSTVRSLALACVAHGGREIAIIGHTDCLFFHPGKLLRTDHWRNWLTELGSAVGSLSDFVNRHPEERLNVGVAVRLARESPLISKRIPIHGLIVDVESGRLDWVVNGYENAPSAPSLAAFATDSQTSLSATPGGEPGRPEKGDFKIGGHLPPIGSV